MSKNPVPVSIALLMAVLVTAGASAQSWTYDATRKGGRGRADGQAVQGVVTLEESEGKATLRLVGGPNDPCLKGALPAVVTRTPETTTIEPRIEMSGCEAFRLVIRNDGSGGVREIRRGDGWVGAKSEHGLVPVK
jgi:hypothetical protein